MHAIQTSGNCVRNITTDQFAGVAADEIVDPRPWCEIIRQWSTLPPRVRLPAAQVQDRRQRRDRGPRRGARSTTSALHAVRDDRGEVGFRVIVGGGLGRTPIIGVRDPRVPACGGSSSPTSKRSCASTTASAAATTTTRRASRSWSRSSAPARVRPPGRGRVGAPAKAARRTLTARRDRARRRALHARRPTRLLGGDVARTAARWPTAGLSRAGSSATSTPHKRAGLRSVTLSLKTHGVAARATSPPTQMDARRRPRRPLQVRRTARHPRAEPRARRRARGRAARRCGRSSSALGLATPNIGLLTDIICCPGGDFCALANAKSIPVAAGDPARASTTSTTCTTSARSTSTSPAA